MALAHGVARRSMLLGVMLTGLPVAIGCTDGAVQVDGHRLAAEGYFNGVYACDTVALDTLAAADIVVSYPIFESVLGTSALRGHRDVSAFAARFCSRWSDPELTFHEVVEEGDRMVLVWEFAATSAAPDSTGTATAQTRESWGGITFLRFDASGRVVEELGEESTPGPVARLRTDV